jgi:hypothetical protein
MVTTIEYGQWAQRMTLLELEQIAIPLNQLLGLYECRLAALVVQEGWERLPGPPEQREVASTFPDAPSSVLFIWPVCREVEQDDKDTNPW